MIVRLRRSAFTLVELLVVIAIIGILVALLLPAVQAAREAARRSQCVNNLKQCGLGLQLHESAKKQLPGGSSYLDAKERSNWAIEMFPFIEEQAIYDQLEFDPVKAPDGMKHALNSPVVERTLIGTLICPSDNRGSVPIKRNTTTETQIRFNTASSRNPNVSQALWYTARMGPTIPDRCDFGTTGNVCMGCDMGTTVPWGAICAPCVAGKTCLDSSKGVGMFGRSPKGIKLGKVTDGLSKTIAVGETLPYDCIWNCLFCDNHPVSSTHIPVNNREADEPAINLLRPWRSHGYKSDHPGGVNVVMGDGSVQFVQETVDHFLYNAMGSKASGDQG